MSDYALIIGRALRGPITDVWREGGRERALGLVDDVNRGEGAITVRWVWLDGRETGEGVPEAASISIDQLDTQGGSVLVGSPGEVPRLVSYVPVEVPGEPPGALEVAQPLARRAARTRTAIQRVSVLLGGLLVASALTIQLLGVRLVGRPLGLLKEKAERVGAGDLSGSLHIQGAGELDDVALSFNRMCEELTAAQARIAAETDEKIKALEQLRHADRLRTVGRLASGIAHELGTPLNVVSGRATLIEGGKLSAAEVGQSAAIIRAQAERMTQIIRQLLDFARRRSSEKSLMDVVHVATSTCELIAPEARKGGVTLEAVSHESERPVARGNESELQQVLSNLLMNAIHAMPDGGRVRVEVARVQATPPATPGGQRAFIQVAVRDEGHGIAEEHLEHVFEPFFTTKEVGSGTGLGLSIVYGIVQDHGGWIDVESEPGRGSCFTFYLPEDGS